MKIYSSEQIRNVVLLGHGGSGKTTLVEAMAHVDGIVTRQGKVDEGNTISDFDKEEIKRGFSINTSCIPLEWLECKLNMLDAPGYFDFVGEAKEATRVADSAVIVVSGRSGVEVGTEKAWEYADEMEIPRIVFVTDMDDDNASYKKALDQLKESFGKKVAPFQVPIREGDHFVGFVNVVKMEGRKFVKDHVEPCEIPVTGIVKAYTTRVGNGPFPSEDFGQDGKTMADVGKEVGTTTGRGRRCGWFDAIAVKHASRLNGCDQLSLMKLDVLDGFEKIKICVAYEVNGCIQCNQCAYVCPHAAIRPFLLTEEEKANAPEGFTTLKAMGKDMGDYGYKIQVSSLDCTGCGNCADICPAKNTALEMKPIGSQTAKEVTNWDYAVSLPVKDDLMALNTVKGSQFAQPLFEFSGACAGCGETPYMKLVTQLYGDRMLVANATGCSSIWGGSAPSTPYCKNAEGKGPAWANSLFEDNAEYGYGMALAVKTIRKQMAEKAEALQALNIDDALKAPFKAWLEGMEDADASKAATIDVLAALAKDVADAEAKEILTFFENNKDYLIKKSVWIVGGDGWSYDIGYGGLDHVLASGENVNVLVFDTEVYSNTGGQASKATPSGAVAKFAASGMKIKKKDLGLIATTYGYVYVAQTAMGANKNQLMKVMQEAEAYDGPSLILCYAPCIAHGIKTGMGTTQNRMKEAVEAGYWHLWKYNPTLSAEGKNPFILESKEPSASFQDFLMGESRYTQLVGEFPEEAKRLFANAEKEAKERYDGYVRMANMEF